MFQSARLRLTFWYLIIIAFISISFSAIIYRFMSLELERGFVVAEYRLRGQPIPRERVRIILEKELADAKHSVLLNLLTINGIILVVAGVGGYFLAGKTLKPIEEVVDEQKRFIADASHELRTPLTSMKSEIEVLLRDKKIKLSEAKGLLFSNLEEVNKMKELSDYLLSLSKYEANAKDLPMEAVDLAEAVKQAADRNASLAKEKDIAIKKDVQNSVIKGNPMSIVELISILLNNAIKYSHSGSKVEVSVAKTNRHVLLKVKDIGVGIPKEDIPHIFDRFYRADSSRCKHTTDGFGLGLAIAKSITDLHHAELKVESQVNKGSVFKVTFPR